MTQKKRLVDLIETMPSVTDIMMDDHGDVISNRALNRTEDIADYLLSNGVIVPPCKVGDTLYSISGDSRLLRSDVTGFEVDESGIDFFLEYGSCSDYEIGKRWFLTQKEAEKALKERDGK